MIFERAKAEFDWAESKNTDLSQMDQQRTDHKKKWTSRIPAALAVISLVAFLTAYVITR